MYFKLNKPHYAIPVLILLAVSIEPVLHHWLDGYETAEAVATGLHTADSSIYLHAMDMLHNGFYSPFATCKAPHGPNDIAFLPAPFHWLYAVIGVVGNGLGIKPFLFLGWANAFFGAIYLWAVYRFLRVIIPKYTVLTFTLFVASGSVGGILYLIGLLAGWQSQPEFDTWFLRLSMYELVEGPYLVGTQHIPRLYYTLPLALVYGSMTAFIQSLRIQCNRHLVLTGIMLFAAAFLNLRIGGLGYVLMLLYLLSSNKPLFMSRVQLATRITVPLAIAFAMFALLTMLNPTFMKNTGVLVREGIWLSAFISAAAFHLLLCRRPIQHAIAQLSPLAQRIAFATLGYLAAYSIFFAGYQIYYGNSLRAGDFSAAVAVSDFALLGLLAAIKKPTTQTSSDEENAYPWLVLWLLVFVALGLSAFGQGWFLRLTPQRLMLFIGVPLCACSAQALQTWGQTNRRAAYGYGSTMILLGLISTLVGALFFQGPLGRVPGSGPFPELHPEIMSHADARLLKQLPSANVLAPYAFSDVIAVQTEAQVLGGTGSTDLSDQMSTELTPRIEHFFSIHTTNAERSDFLDEWCIDFVYCPDTWPVDPSVLEALAENPSLISITQDNQGAIFGVITE